MIYNYILLILTLLFFAISLSPKDYRWYRAVIWLAFSTLILLAIVYPDAGKGWF